MSHDLALCYHAVGEGWPSAVPAGRLAEHAQILLRRGYEPVTLSELVHEPRRGRRVAFTFDDAYASVLTDAFPRLSELGVAATVFAVTNFAESGSPLAWDGLLESGVSGDVRARSSLSWTDLRLLADAGWEIGSHTCTHPHLTALEPDELAHELTASRSACEHALGRECRAIAYPYGDLDDRVVAAAAAAGYDTGCSLSIATTGPLAWPRIGIYGVDASSRFRLKISPSVLALRRALAGRGRGG